MATFLYMVEDIVAPCCSGGCMLSEMEYRMCNQGLDKFGTSLGRTPECLCFSIWYDVIHHMMNEVCHMSMAIDRLENVLQFFKVEHMVGIIHCLWQIFFMASSVGNKTRNWDSSLCPQRMCFCKGGIQWGKDRWMLYPT